MTVTGYMPRTTSTTGRTAQRRALDRRIRTCRRICCLSFCHWPRSSDVSDNAASGEVVSQLFSGALHISGLHIGRL